MRKIDFAHKTGIGKKNNSRKNVDVFYKIQNLMIENSDLSVSEIYTKSVVKTVVNFEEIFFYNLPLFRDKVYWFEYISDLLSLAEREQN